MISPNRVRICRFIYVPCSFTRFICANCTSFPFRFVQGANSIRQLSLLYYIYPQSPTRSLFKSGLPPAGCFCFGGSLIKKKRRQQTALLGFVLIDSRGGHRESRGDFALCGARPGSTWTGQPARLDRAGPRARTRLSPAGGIPFAARWCLRCFLGDLVTFRFLLPFLSLFLTPFSSLMTR